MPLAGKTLDERWLEFARLTAPVVREHPHLAPVRQPFYKLQFEQGYQAGFGERAKDLLRIGMYRDSSRIPEGASDVVFWLHGSREPEIEAVIPLWQRAQAMQLRAVVVVPSQLLDGLSLPASNTVAFSAPQRYGKPGKWKRVYDDLVAVLPEMANSSAKQLLAGLGRQEDSYEREIEKIFASLKPKLLVLPVDQFMPGGSACVVARRVGIRSLVLLHGAVSAYNAPLTADTMAVWGEVSKEQMRGLGVPEENLKILGSPRHDVPAHRDDPTAKQRLQQKFGFDSMRILTFFSNGNDPYRNSRTAIEECARWLMLAADKLKNRYHILVRLHPNEDGSLYAGCQGLRVFKDDCDLGTTLAGSDIVAALCSTVLAEAVLYEKPVLQFYAEGWPDLADNWRRGLALRVQSSDDLTSTLVRLNDEPERVALVTKQQRLRSELFANVGCATEAVARHIYQECATWGS